MKIPKSINVGGVIVKVKIVKTMPKGYEGCCGAAFNLESVIYLNANMSASKKEHDFWHEVAHFVGWHVFFNRSRDITEEQTELLADCLRTLVKGG